MNCIYKFNVKYLLCISRVGMKINFWYGLSFFQVLDYICSRTGVSLS